QRFPFEVFPYGTLTSRQADKDHSVPYDPGGPPGQTSADNLAPLGRRTHRLKTFAPGWRHIRVGPRAFLWRTPTGYWYRVDPDGTHSLGKTISVMEEHFGAFVRAA
ncbi:MAG TPA: HNH endonuclease signature motif containing protein, partial [Nocardioidaceae bacterium]|nr:HNH endonuclease signature motif containing protein [Nocardioidaceae bacterium]